MFWGAAKRGKNGKARIGWCTLDGTSRDIETQGSVELWTGTILAKGEPMTGIHSGHRFGAGSGYGTILSVLRRTCDCVIEAFSQYHSSASPANCQTN